MRILREAAVLRTAGAAMLAGGLMLATTAANTTTEGVRLGAGSASGASRHGPVMRPDLAVAGAAFDGLAPPTEKQCLKQDGILCYGAPQIETDYDEVPLFSRGITGRGETIVIVDSFGAPAIKQDLAYFDRTYGLPAPPRFTILPFGPVPPYTPGTATMTGWAEETTLDVEYAHTIAPGANILLVETATSETLGVTGFPTMIAAENYVVDHHLGDVISQSFGAGEFTFESPRTIRSLRSAYENAYRNGVTVLAASGDTGATQVETDAGLHYFPFRTVEWPASDPLVTAVGGTQLTLNEAGRPTAPPKVWNDTTLLGGPAASSGGTSDVFSRPSYQDGVASVVGNRRGLPDISMSASVSGAVLIYISGITGTGASHGAWLPIGGTSEATPEFSGIVALADQEAGHSLGLINPAIYAIAATDQPGVVPISEGNNTVWWTTSGHRVTVQGYSANGAYNLATGVGTVNAAAFVPELAKTAGAVGDATTYGTSATFLPST